MVWYVSQYLLCSGEAVSENSSIFRTRKLKSNTSASLYCGGISCGTDLEAMLQCHMEAGCMAAWFHMNDNNIAFCGTCVCTSGGINYDMAGTTLHMKDFREYIPGKIYPCGIKTINNRCVRLITFHHTMYSYSQCHFRSKHLSNPNQMRIHMSSVLLIFRKTFPYTVTMLSLKGAKQSSVNQSGQRHSKKESTSSIKLVIRNSPII